MRETVIVRPPSPPKVDRAVLGIAHTPRGYRNIVLQNAEERNPIEAEYHRPHRKDLMDTVLRRRVQSLGAPMIATGGNIEVNRKHHNPVAAAIDLPYIAESKLQAVRQPPKLPPALEAQVHVVKGYRAALAVVEKEREVEQNLKETKLELRVNDKVRAEMGDYVGSGQKELFHEPVNVRSAETRDRDVDLTTTNQTMHKSSWLQNVVRKRDSAATRRIDERIPKSLPVNFGNSDTLGSAFDLEQLVGNGIITTTDRPLLKPSESFSTRNVPFMLEVWQRAEGINLQAAVSGYAKDEARRVADARRSLNTKLQDLAESGRFSMGSRPGSRPSTAGRRVFSADNERVTHGRPSIRSATRRSSVIPKSPSGHTSSQKSDRPRSSIANRDTPQMPEKTLSHSTVRFLKKLTREGLDPTQTVLTDGNVDALVRITLTGAEFESRERVSDVYARGSSGSGRSILLRRVPPRKRRAYAPGQWHKAMKAAEEGRLLTASDGTIGADDQGGIRLVIPDVREFRDDDDTSTVTDDSLQLRPNASRPAPPGTELPKSLSTDGDMKFLQALGKPTRRRSSVFGASQLLRTVKSNMKPAVLSDLPSFSVARLTTMLKRRAKENPISKVEAAPERTSHEPSISAPIIKTLTDFLETPYTNLEQIPPTDSPGYIALCKTLILALGEEEDRPLRFEASRLLIALDAHHSLGRWEGIAFRKTLGEMLKDGGVSERALAAVTLATMGIVDSAVLDELRRELGDVDTVTRRRAVECLEMMDLSHAEQLLEALLSDADSTSWRVRQDVIELLECWVGKLSQLTLEQPKQPPPETRISSRKASMIPDSARISSASTRPSTRASNKAMGEEDPMEIARREQLQTLRRQVKAAVETLLRLMWNDWNSTVRDAAAASLGRLGKGQHILDWIVGLLSSPDPLKRIDALKSLTRLGVVTENAVDKFLACFRDEFATVRVEACKLACILASGNRDLVNALLDCFDDFDWRVRAYAVKAIGTTKNTDPQVHESLRCALYHDAHPSVRAEAIQSAQILGLLATSKDLQEAVFTLMETDASPAVRTESEKALITLGLIFPSNVMETDTGSHMSRPKESQSTSTTAGTSQPAPLLTGGASTTATSRVASMNMVPFPHLLVNRRPSEVEVFLRSSLVAEKEQEAVIDQVRGMAEKETVTAEVAELELWKDSDDNDAHLHLYPADHIPDLKSIHGKKRRKRIDAGIGEIVRKLPGVPFERKWQKRKVADMADRLREVQPAEGCEVAKEV
ncbi:uncharacterized protein SPPG_04727 [Spizellomyces punctatus DAOM BR117]|uniref:Uncharacterized protein n=1 Tax=Spizellomyces punctatus (strain DAOM BR117) TaxID=645134 RepID=A0A0L0HHV9_SPIPD|nr:uncharacterized protein SPPG_04727 [Spizellomyces punctatus DAOM BR117]KND00404.1 hypothetical protein SPPG_04727 [Spizellomyces punctatus DAOM BR117]|eukprot:XP_016608443.1 hypothetical protein SPPG_04727 [Spizellomyces punctatus DAOM BR117]